MIVECTAKPADCAAVPHLAAARNIGSALYNPVGERWNIDAVVVLLA